MSYYYSMNYWCPRCGKIYTLNLHGGDEINKGGALNREGRRRRICVRCTKEAENLGPFLYQLYKIWPKSFLFTNL